MSDSAPEVSIIMPMRNAAPYVGQALESLLVETEVRLEVVVIDDGSTDRSRSVVETVGDDRIRLLEGPREGIAAAFNAGLQSCRGELIMRCDADDLYPPGRIGRQVAWLRDHLEFGAICGAFAAMNSQGRSRLRFGTGPEPGEITDELRDGVIRTAFCTFAIRADVLKQLEGARPFFVTAEDIDLQYRLGEACRVWYSPEPSYLYRIHDSSITHRRRPEDKEFFDDCARTFQVQRRMRGNDDLQLGVPPYLAASQGGASSAKAHMQGLLVGATWSAYREGNYSGALSFAFQGALASPASFDGWRNLAAVLVKTAVHGMVRRT